jgi:hypothetical protein
MNSPSPSAQRKAVIPLSMLGGRRCTGRLYPVLDQKNSPSRLRFRPLPPLTFAFRLLPSDSVSTYLRSVLGARGNLGGRKGQIKASKTAVAAICDLFCFPHFHSFSCNKH